MFAYSQTALLALVSLNFYWGMEAMALGKEVRWGGIIAEPGNPKLLIGVLSHISVEELAIFCCALPLAGCIQGVDMVTATTRLLRLWCRCSRVSSLLGWLAELLGFDEAEGDEEAGEAGRGRRHKKNLHKKGFCYRCFKTVRRRLAECW